MVSSSIHLILPLSLWLVTFTLSPSSVSADYNSKDDHDESFEDISRFIGEIKVSGIAKRSAAKLSYDEVLFQSLTSFCSQLGSYSPDDVERGIFSATRTTDSGRQKKRKNKRGRKKNKRRRTRKKNLREKMQNDSIREDLDLAMQDSIPKSIQGESNPSSYDEIIYRSLWSLCSKLTSYDTNIDYPQSTPPPPPPPVPSDNSVNPSAQSTSSPDLPKRQVLGSVPDWDGPDVLPVSVEAERRGDTVFLAFQVVHTAPAYMVRSESLHPLRVDIDHPSDSATAIKSQVNITVDTTVCRDEAIADKIEDEYLFMLQGQPWHQSVLTLNLCTFDKVWRGTPRKKVGRWETIRRVFTQELLRPQFKLSPDPGNEIIIQHGHDVTLEADVDLVAWKTVDVSAQLWNHTRGRMSVDKFSLFLDNDTDKYDLGFNIRRRSILSSEELKTNTTQSEGTSPATRVRIHVKTAGGGASGKVAVVETWGDTGASPKPIVRMFEIARIIHLRLPEKTEVIPRNHLRAFRRSKNKCDTEGNMYTGKHGRNCTLFCVGFGEDVETVTIEKVPPTAAPFHSVSYNLSDEMVFAMVDMGPASSDIDGNYKCTVRNSDGNQKTEDIELTASHYTKVTAITIEEFNNETTKLTFTAYGKHRISMYPEIIEDTGRTVDLLYGRKYDRPKEVVFGDFKNQTFFLPTDALRYPSTHIDIFAKGRRGYASRKAFLPPHISSYSKQPRLLHSLPDTTYVYDNGNGTVTIGCCAVGTPPISIKIFLHILSRVDSRADVTRMETVTGPITNVTVIVPFDYVRRKPRQITCEARNSFGSDRHQIDTNDFLELEKN